MIYGRMTPSEKAHQTRYYRAARELAGALQACQDEVQVVAAFAAHPASRKVKADAYDLLDRGPRRFDNSNQWHPLLRSTRNHPVHGRELFATWAEK